MIILVIIAFLFIRFGLHISIFEVIKSIPYMVKDVYSYIKYKKWRIFNKFGLELFTGKFGNGKTLQAVKYVLNLHNRFPDVPIYSNIDLFGVNYIPLSSFQQIVDIETQAIVLIDEMGVMFNCREYGSFPMALLDNILQCRHRGILIVGTAQKYEDVDLIIRKNLSWIHETRKLCGRLLTYDSYDGYRVYYSTIDYHNLKPDVFGVFRCIYDRDRIVYDTTAIATNITNVIDDDAYDKHKSKVESKTVNKFKRRYSAKKYSV